MSDRSSGIFGMFDTMGELLPVFAVTYFAYRLIEASLTRAGPEAVAFFGASVFGGTIIIIMIQIQVLKE